MKIVFNSKEVENIEFVRLGRNIDNDKLTVFTRGTFDETGTFVDEVNIGEISTLQILTNEDESIYSKENIRLDSVNFTQEGLCELHFMEN